MKRFARVKYEPITVKEPHKYNVQTFQDPDEFTAYYREHEDAFKGISTLVLNRTYKIPGYRISIVGRGTDKEELILKKDYYGSGSDSVIRGVESDYAEQIASILKRLDNIEHFLERI